LHTRQEPADQNQSRGATVQILTAEQAAELVESGDTVIVGGVVSMVAPEAAMRALGERFLRDGEPHGLTIICPNRTGWMADGEPHGVEHFAHPGMVDHVITSTFNAPVSPKFMHLVMDRRIDASVVPMGVLFRWMRECTAQSPGLLTQVGIGTFFDPAIGASAAGDAGRVVAHSNRVARRVEIDGRACIFMPSMKIDVSLIRGTVADTEGNLTLEDEPVNGGALQMAMAARTSGGKVIAVVKALTEKGTLHPRQVQVPGIFVDAVVVDPSAIQSQAGHEPAFTGQVRMPSVPLPLLELGCSKVILRRAAMELCRGDIVNLGFGMGTQLPSVAAEEGVIGDLRFSVEHGAIGGIPSAGGAFGAHYNPSAIIDPIDLFDFYHGGGLDATILGFAEVDRLGNVNVGGSYTGSLRGPGGFVDIVHRTRKVLICGTLTSGGLRAVFPKGASVQIVNEGRHRKFKAQVDHIDLCGPAAVERGQRVLVVTERCVFEVWREGLTLVEVAPGIDPARHIAPYLDFELRCASPLRVMPAELFSSEPAGLRLRDRAELA
jgi:acyl CoA:acetate/3-ketoacid CoA transferase